MKKLSYLFVVATFLGFLTFACNTAPKEAATEEVEAPATEQVEETVDTTAVVDTTAAVEEEAVTEESAEESTEGGE